MSASSGCGHATWVAYVKGVPKTGREQMQQMK
jgi:hypothetical protein